MNKIKELIKLESSNRDYLQPFFISDDTPDYSFLKTLRLNKLLRLTFYQFLVGTKSITELSKQLRNMSPLEQVRYVKISVALEFLYRQLFKDNVPYFNFNKIKPLLHKEASESPILGTLSKSSKDHIPENYFKAFSNCLLNRKKGEAWALKSFKIIKSFYKPESIPSSKGDIEGYGFLKFIEALKVSLIEAPNVELSLISEIAFKLFYFLEHPKRITLIKTVFSKVKKLLSNSKTLLKKILIVLDLNTLKNYKL